MNKYLKYAIMGGAAAVFSVLVFQSSPKKEAEPVSVRTYQEIIASGILYAVTEYNSISFHLQEDTLGGLHYELLQVFAREKGLKVEITPEMSLDKRIAGLNTGRYDILANNEVINSSRKDSLLLTSPLLTSKQVLVQRKPRTDQDSTYISSPLELAHRTLHIVKGSPHILRIKNLSNEIGDTIFIEEIEKYGPEQLIAMVANNDIDYTVCDETIAKAAAKELPEIDIQTPVSFNQFYSWGVNKQNQELLDTLNTWIEQYRQTEEFKGMMKKYSTN